MRHNLVQIEDKKGRLFHIEIWTPSGGTRLKFWRGRRDSRIVGEWKLINHGFVRFFGGEAFRVERGDWINSPADLYLGFTPGTIDYGNGTGWGIVLRNYDNSFGTNDIGTGRVEQPWVLGLEPGMVAWRRPDAAEFIKAVLQHRPRS